MLPTGLVSRRFGTAATLSGLGGCLPKVGDMSIDMQREFSRTVETAKLNVATIEEIEADDSATVTAGIIVVVSGIIGSLGTVLMGGGLWGFIAWTAATIAGWFVWAAVSTKVAQDMFGVQTTDRGEMLRVIGYGSAPRALGFLPFVGFLVTLWTFALIAYGVVAAVLA